MEVTLVLEQVLHNVIKIMTVKHGKQ